VLDAEDVRNENICAHVEQSVKRHGLGAEGAQRDSQGSQVTFMLATQHGPGYHRENCFLSSVVCFAKPTNQQCDTTYRTVLSNRITQEILQEYDENEVWYPQ
jgi:hypothetical protein